MAKKPEAQTDDLDDQIDEGMGDFEEDGTAAIIRKIVGDDADEEDDGGFDQPADEDEASLDVVSAAEGQKRVEKAQTKREQDEAAERKGLKRKGEAAESDDAQAEAKPKDGEADASQDAAASKKPEAAEAPDLTKAPVADLIKDVPEATRAELSRRFTEFEKINTLFAGREEEMKAHGLDGPADVISRLLHLNAYAQKNPAEYIAWVARETGGDKAHEALEKAAASMGYKLVQDSGADDDDDPFMTDRERQQAAELKRLRAEQASPPQNTGPMAPEQIAQQQALQVINSLKVELDPATGAQKRPYWANVEHLIAQRATAHRAQTQAAPTREDLARFYDESVAQLQGMFGGGNNSAAQTPAPAPQRDQQTAEATARAKAASKTIDGTGQGASRRPALSEDASIEEVIRHSLAQQEG